MSAKKCQRCGSDEFRLDGYCSVYCATMHEVEQERDEARRTVETLRALVAELESDADVVRNRLARVDFDDRRARLEEREVAIEVVREWADDVSADRIAAAIRARK